MKLEKKIRIACWRIKENKKLEHEAFTVRENVFLLPEMS